MHTMECHLQAYQCDDGCDIIPAKSSYYCCTNINSSNNEEDLKY